MSNLTDILMDAVLASDEFHQIVITKQAEEVIEIANSIRADFDSVVKYIEELKK